MAKILYFGTNGSENPTKALVPFVGANASVEAGDQAMIHLFGDAVVLMRDVVVNSIVPVGWPPLKETMATTISNKIPIYVWGACSAARGVTDADLQGKNAKFTTFKEFAEHIAAVDKVVSV